MRLMIGDENDPRILVEVEDHYDPRVFKFWVVNGCWNGAFDNGRVFVEGEYGDGHVVYTAKILCDDQDRLRGDYQDVFNNFSNEDYKAPSPAKCADMSDIDDDIPF